jgi:hypothetical protein
MTKVRTVPPVMSFPCATGACAEPNCSNGFNASGPQLVFVRYSRSHGVNAEWVYNQADLMHPHVIWARDLGAEHNQLPLKQMPDGTVWVLNADNRDPQLVPYADAVTPAGVPSPETRGIPEEDSQQ